MRLANVMVLAACILLPQTVRGGLTVVETDMPDGHLTTFKLTVTPAAEPVPALKQRLMLREIDLVQGNAAPYYYRALMGAAAARQAVTDQFGEASYDWIDISEQPLDELPLDQLRQAAQVWQGPVMVHLRAASRRRDCDWEWNVEEIRGQETMSFLLDEIQESRTLARALALQFRLALAEGRIEDAVDLLRINYRLSRDVAREPVLVCNLVGLAIAGVCNEEVLELIGQPDSPNMYWALTELPSPLIDIRQSICSEMSLGLRMFPFILDVETVEHSPQEWSRLLAKAFLESQSLISGDVRPDREHQLAATRLAVTAGALVFYPHAKQRLIDSGMDAKRVEQMPVGQVVAIDSLREYRRVADEIEKWQYIPYHEVRARNIQDPFADGAPLGSLARGYGYVLAAAALPAVTALRSAEQRVVWQINAIRTVEAIRMHAAKTGRLPRTLSEIQVVPVPDNPATGEPYLYQLDGQTAVLDLPSSDGFHAAWRFEISLAK